MTYIGRVAHEKNIGFLVQVLQRVLTQAPQAMLVIAGEGPAREGLRAQVAALGLAASVHFAGYLARDTELLDCYAAADAFVFASRTETQGLVLLEAMAQGAAVVSTGGVAVSPIRAGATSISKISAGHHAPTWCASSTITSPNRSPIRGTHEIALA